MTMVNRAAKTSPLTLARWAGVLYLTTVTAGLIAQVFISGRIVVGGDASATAANILAQKDLFQLGFTVYLIEMAAQVAQTAVFYLLLRPVSRGLALVALVLGLVGCTIKTLSRLFYIAPLVVLGGAPYLAVFGGEQRESLALLLLNVNDQAAGMALAFFGLSTLLNGYLVLRSTFLPRFLGVLSIVGGIGWLSFLYPPLGNQLFPLVALVGLLGSAANILWLLIVGVNAEKWQQRAAATA
jgi:hypothetical protein